MNADSDDKNEIIQCNNNIFPFNIQNIPRATNCKTLHGWSGFTTGAFGSNDHLKVVVVLNYILAQIFNMIY